MKSQPADFVIHHWPRHRSGLMMYHMIKSILGDSQACYQDDRKSPVCASGWRALFSSRKVMR